MIHYLYLNHSVVIQVHFSNITASHHTRLHSTWVFFTNSTIEKVHITSIGHFKIFGCTFIFQLKIYCL